MQKPNESVKEVKDHTIESERCPKVQMYIVIKTDKRNNEKDIKDEVWIKVELNEDGVLK